MEIITYQGIYQGLYRGRGDYIPDDEDCTSIQEVKDILSMGKNI